MASDHPYEQPRHATQEERWDHARDLRKHDIPVTPLPLDQRCAVASLVGYAEGIIGSGILPVDCEIRLREIVAQALTAFDMPSKSERVSS